MEPSIADALSRLYTIEAERRGWKSPTEEERISMLETFHSEGHMGEKQMIAKITEAGYWVFFIASVFVFFIILNLANYDGAN
jgi:hypothetical protein